MQDSLRDVSSIPDLKRKCNLLHSDNLCDYGSQKHDILSDDDTWKGVLYARNPVHVIQQQLSLWNSILTSTGHNLYAINSDRVQRIREHVTSRTFSHGNQTFD